MSKDIERIRKIVDSHKSHWKSINDGIMEGTSEGIKEGVAEGLKAGVKDGLKDCLIKGFVNIGDEDIGDILRDIPEDIIRNRVKAKAKDIFAKSTDDYTQIVFQKIRNEIQRRDIRLSKEQVGNVLDIIRKSQQVALNSMMSRLSRNPFSRDLVYGMQAALTEDLEEKLEVYEEKLK